ELSLAGPGPRPALAGEIRRSDQQAPRRRRHRREHRLRTQPAHRRRHPDRGPPQRPQRGFRRLRNRLRHALAPPHGRGPPLHRSSTSMPDGTAPQRWPSLRTPMNQHTERLAGGATPGAGHTGRPPLLYVAWGFPPCRSGGVYRALATANRFAARGWRVTVITAQRETFIRYTGADTSLEQRIDPSIRVVRLPFSWPVLEPDLRRWSRLRIQRPGLWAKARARRDQVPFPEIGYGPWRRPLEAAAERIHRDDPVDLVLSTANPHVAFTAGYRLHRRHGVP